MKWNLQFISVVLLLFSTAIFKWFLLCFFRNLLFSSKHVMHFDRVETMCALFIRGCELILIYRFVITQFRVDGCINVII